MPLTGSYPRSFPGCSAQMLQHHFQHPAYRFRRAQEQLVAYGERRQVLWAEGHFAEPPYRDVQGAGDPGRTQLGQGILLCVVHQVDPLVVAGYGRLDLVQAHVPVQLMIRPWLWQAWRRPVRSNRPQAYAQKSALPPHVEEEREKRNTI